MYMSGVTRGCEAEKYPELAGARVVITGLSSTAGGEVAQAFAERKARLIIQTAEHSRCMRTKKRLLEKSAAEVKFIETSFKKGSTPTRFAQEASRSFGSIEILINLVCVSRDECEGMRSMNQIENLIVKKLSTMREITEVTANRMALTWSEGLILNMLLLFPTTSSEEAALAGLLKSTLATMTRDQAQRWADSAVRVNAVAPHMMHGNQQAATHLTSEKDLAALALFLASHKGRKLTGHIFDTDGIARQRC